VGNRDDCNNGVDDKALLILSKFLLDHLLQLLIAQRKVHRLPAMDTEHAVTLAYDQAASLQEKQIVAKQCVINPVKPTDLLLTGVVSA
jgi:hypothetical protein